MAGTPPATKPEPDKHKIEETPAKPEPDDEPEARGDRPPEPLETDPDPAEPPPPREDARSRTRRQRALERRIHDWLGRIERVEDESSPGGTREYATGVSGLLYVVDPFDGTVLAMHAPNMARAYAQLADESPRFARFLELAMSGGATGAAIFATLPPLMAIAAHHGVDLTTPLRQIQERRASAFGTIPVEPDGTAHVTEPAPPPPPV